MLAQYHELPENFTIESWGDLADDLLCAGQTSAGIRDALVDVWPHYEWFVLVQDNSETWASYRNSNTELHQADNLCGKNLVVWMYSGSMQHCNANTAGVNAQHLIDAASSHGSTAVARRDYIQSRKEKQTITNMFQYFICLDEASYSLTHYFTIPWSSGYSWADSLYQDCAVNNSKALYFIKSGPAEDFDEKNTGQNDRNNGPSADNGGSI